MSAPIPAKNSRIDLIDALRGSALLGLFLLHTVEKFDFGGNPPFPSPWMAKMDAFVSQTVFSLFAGKAYAIFAMMFGVSFFILLDRWSLRGINVTTRFLWRLSVLAIMGYVNGIIYCGDILLIIAVLGLPLVLLHKLSNRTLAWISVGLMLQIPSLWQVGRMLIDTGYAVPRPDYWQLYGLLGNVFANGSFLEVCRINLWEGQLARIFWTVETGRYLQMIGLIIWGLMLGRSRIFQDTERQIRLAKRALLLGIVGYLILLPIERHLGAWGITGMKAYKANQLLNSYDHLALLAVWMGGFVLLYQKIRIRSVLSLLAPFGRMSLTCYVTQGLIGIPIFYNYGLGMFRLMGPTLSVLYGIVFFVLQCGFAHLWLKHFHYGPLEWLWRSLTFMDFSTPMRKRKKKDVEPAVGERIAA